MVTQEFLTQEFREGSHKHIMFTWTRGKNMTVLSVYKLFEIIKSVSSDQ